MGTPVGVDPVAQRAVVHPQIAGDLRDGLASLDHHLHGLSLELRAEPSTLLGHGPILSVERNCPRSLVHPKRRWSRKWQSPETVETSVRRILLFCRQRRCGLNRWGAAKRAMCW